MPQEIERKFLVVPGWVPEGPGTPYRQGYIPTQDGVTVRVRIQGTEARFTLKGPTQGLSRAEYEYPLPVDQAQEILDTLCRRPFIEKVRHVVDYGGHRWEVDVFQGDNAGLVLAEVELTSENEAVDLPPWVGAEVSDQMKYSNSRLAQKPYRTWRKP